MSQNLKFKSVRVTKVAFTAIASILSIALVYAQELQNPKEHNTKVYDVSFSPDDKLLASGSGDAAIKIWDAAIGKELNTLKGHSDRISSISFSPDGKTIASASADKTIKIWSLYGRRTKVLRGHDAEVTNVSFCPDNQVIVSSSVDNTISLWRSDGKLVKTLTVGSSIRNVDCSPDSNIIAVASDDSLKLWSRDGQELQTFNLSSLNNRGKIYIDFTSDDKALLIANDEKKVKPLSLLRWLQAGKKDSYELYAFYENYLAGGNTKKLNINVKSPAVKDGSFISTATIAHGNSGNISINTKSLTIKDEAVINSATVYGNGGNISIYAQSLIVKDGAVISTAPAGQGNAGDISINASEKVSLDRMESDEISSSTSSAVGFDDAVGNGGNININARSILLDNIASPYEYNAGHFKNRDSRVLKPYKKNREKSNKIILSNENSIVASIGGNNTVLLSKNGLLLRTLKHNKPVRAFDFHPNHTILASGCDDGTIYIWNVNTGQLIRSLKVHERKVNKVDYSLDGRRITSTSDDGIVKVWYPDSSTSKGVIVAFVFVFSGVMVLLSITKRRQSKRQKNTSNTQNSYIITGWVICVLPEDWRGDLEALRYELIAANKPKFYVRFITATTLIDMLFGGIRVKLHNLYYGNNFMAVPGRRSITDSKDKSVTHNNLNE
ncbi:WD40 repeat domain-containing protein [Nostoc sp. UHCC 0251]|uniref:WD40 repeat domain-containing protein n=1 Tax=Nostoc sp. UHCC 0251 TaxID=3110240 RepID=UPI002B1FBDC9|nr:hypothetical protein [Nostoc sp. UHCC 0251]MEA5622799.1 hypothetical protein [Nostoc sp. UHCC 0251]